MEKEKITGSEALIKSLIYQGVDTVFGYPGGAIMPVYDSLYKQKEITHILMRHEQSAAHAAEGYARVSGKVGVCIVTSGPGATNTLTGIGDAMLDSTPIVVIAGQVASSALGTDAFQEIDMVSISQPITKWSYQIRRAEDIPWAVARAFYIAKSGRPGPVILDFSKNAQIESFEYVPYQFNFIRSYEPEPQLDFTAIEKAAKLINESEKPLALVGQGVELGNAHQELLTFIEKAQIPFGSTLLGLSALPSKHPLNKGMLGMHGNLAPNVMTNECDLLISIGMRFDDRVTGDLRTYAKQAKVIHFDIDPAEINKNVEVEVSVLGNCKESLPAVTQLLNQNNHSEWIKSFDQYDQKEKMAIIDKELKPETEVLSMGEVVYAVSEATEHEAILVTDVGQNQMAAARYFQFTQKRSIVTSGGLGTMGFGLPAAIGAHIGDPNRTVCLFLGDGGLQMTIQEFGVIMENRLPIKMILLNNSYLGMVRQWQELFFDKRYSFTPMCNPDFIAIAAAYNIQAKKVTNREDLPQAINEMLSTEGPYFMDVSVIKEGMVYPMTPAGGTVNKMILGD
ncbi:MAG: biosynthetic-type acetolactate synthase large subunit [Bacteroidales bacterium]|nr:biosynthetic-type acetolactate synthase large subunit [Bacteroidales bacterium]